MLRFVGIDYGHKRIGLAVGDTEMRIAMPVKQVDGGGDIHIDAKAVWAAVADEAVDVFVVGLPLNMDDSEGPQAAVCRNFADQLRTLSGKPVEMFDERLTSHAAEGMLIEAELTRKKTKKRLDSVAAQLILQGYLDHHPELE
jgi:putative Holliday junction resolvase